MLILYKPSPALGLQVVTVEVIHAYAGIKLMAQLEEKGKYGASTDRRGRSKRIREAG